MVLDEVSMSQSHLIRPLSAMSPAYFLAAGISAALNPATGRFEGQVLGRSGRPTLRHWTRPASTQQELYWKREVDSRVTGDVSY